MSYDQIPKMHLTFNHSKDALESKKKSDKPSLKHINMMMHQLTQQLKQVKQTSKPIPKKYMLKKKMVETSYNKSYLLSHLSTPTQEKSFKTRKYYDSPNVSRTH